MLTVKEVTKKLKENNYDTISLTMEEFMLWGRATDLMNKIGMTVRHFKGGGLYNSRCCNSYRNR